MSEHGSVVVIGGTSDIGKALAAHYAASGFPVVVTSRDRDRAEKTARDVGATCRGLALDLSEPRSIEEGLQTVTDVAHLALVDGRGAGGHHDPPSDSAAAAPDRQPSSWKPQP